MKLKLLEELMEHMDSCQGKGLSDLLAESKKPNLGEGMSEMPESAMDDEYGMKSPKGLKVESIEVLGKKPEGLEKDPMDGPITGEGEDAEMSDEELKELLSQYMG